MKTAEQIQREQYLAYQEALGLKPGDYAKITQKAENWQAGWTNIWNPAMDEYVGKIGKVEKDQGTNGIQIKVEDLECFRFPAYVLEKTTKPVTVTTKEDLEKAYLAFQDSLGLKPGDYVKVTCKVKGRFAGWANSWIVDMDSSVGKVFKVTKIDGHHGIQLDVHDYGYPAYALVKVAPPSTEPDRSCDECVNYEAN